MDNDVMKEDKTIVVGDTTGKMNRVGSTQKMLHEGDGVDSTWRNDRTERRDEGGGRGQIIAAGSVTFVLKGKSYKAVRSISESSGEAQIVLVEHEGKQYCLKVYYPNYRFKNDILSAVWNVDMDMVVKLYDFGHTTVNGLERDYELMEFLEGGTLAQFELGGDEQAFRIIALQAAASLAAIHNYGIIHKDIKPGNFFFRDEEHTQLVLGDFGISTMIREGEELLRTSQARTPAFAAPEMYDDVIDGEVEIDEKVDFYSLGITLLYLWLGKNPFVKNERLMMRLKQEGRLPHLDELPPRVAMIVKGLTSVNPQRRWGYEEVERWFLGEDVAVDTSSMYLRYKAFLIDPDRNIAAHDLKELVPLLFENQQLGIRYLYSNRLSTWLDECGNSKMAVLLTDIVEHKYPTNQQAGLMAALYAMESNFPYHDVEGKPCTNAHDIAESLLRNAKEYSYRLQDSQDDLFVYLDAHYSLNMGRIRSYFAPSDEMSVVKLAYEIDQSMPFLSSAPSSSIKEITKAFASPARTADEWASLSDGRLLAWLHGKADRSLCEAVRVIGSHGSDDARTVGLQVLYNIDRSSAFDLQDANTVHKVALQLESKLEACQDLDVETFTNQLKDYLQLGGLLEVYAQLHQWTGLLEAMHQMLDLRNPVNTERYAIYDQYTAAYKFCKAIGGQPAYEIKGEDYCVKVHTIDELRKLPVKDVRMAIRNGHLMQWMSTFYHENPATVFEDERTYNECVRDFLQELGTYDSSEIHYKRYVLAQEQMERKSQDSRAAWNASIKNKQYFRIVFLGVNLLWLVMVGLFGIDQTPNMVSHVYTYTVLVLGVPLGIVFAIQNYFRGNGFSLGILYICLGVILSLVPAAVLSLCLHNYPGATRFVVLAMSIAYLCMGLKYAFGKGTVGHVTEEMKEALKLDESEALNEQLYYTFRMRSFKFKGSSYALIDDAVGEARSNSTEKVINCIMWSLVPGFLVLAMLWYHSAFLGHNGPDIGAWKEAWVGFWTQFIALFY